MTKSLLQSQYEENVAAYKKLGLKIPIQLFELPKDELNAKKGQLVTAPAITKDFTFNDLLAAYKAQYGLYVYEDLWNEYSDELEGPASIIIADMTIGNEYGDPGVQHTNETLVEQRQIKGTFISPQEAVILVTIMKLRGDEFAPNTFIRFPQLSNKTVSGSRVGGIYSDGGQSCFGWRVGGGGSRYGVSLVAGSRITLEPQTSTTVMIPPEIVLQELTFNGRVYRLVETEL